MRRFVLLRESDPSGVSGTGVVAEGVEFTGGTAVVHWLRAPHGLNIYARIEDLLAVHGHGGATKIEWLDGGNGHERTSGVESVLYRGQA